MALSCCCWWWCRKPCLIILSRWWHGQAQPRTTTTAQWPCPQWLTGWLAGWSRTTRVKEQLVFGTERHECCARGTTVWTVHRSLKVFTTFSLSFHKQKSLVTLQSSRFQRQQTQLLNEPGRQDILFYLERCKKLPALSLTKCGDNNRRETDREAKVTNI